MLGLCAALGIALGAQAGVQGQEAKGQGTPAVTQKKVGEYTGVLPGKSPPRKNKPRNRMTWLGFQPKGDGTARLFVQLTSEVSFEQEVRDGSLYVKLDGVKYGDRNARRRLDTRFFATTLRLVTSRAVGKRRARKGKPAQTMGIELRIQFKNASDTRQARAELVEEKDGYHYLFLDFNESSGGDATTSDKLRADDVEPDESDE